VRCRIWWGWPVCVFLKKWNHTQRKQNHKQKKHIVVTRVILPYSLSSYNSSCSQNSLLSHSLYSCV
jgi:hypothetical protein